jgi:hypothetical protein
VTSQGSAHGRFTRAVARGNVFAAETAARELRRLGLDDALALTALLAEANPARYERAAVRWHGRLELEVRLLTLAESQLALAALAALPGPAAGGARDVLGWLGRRHRLALDRALLPVRDAPS